MGRDEGMKEKGRNEPETRLREPDTGGGTGASGVRVKRGRYEEAPRRLKGNGGGEFLVGWEVSLQD